MVKFSAYLFDGKNTAMKALHTLEDRDVAYVWVDDVAVVSKSKHGILNIRSTWAQDDAGEFGLGWGALCGGLLGALAGPGGALAGAAMGGSLGGLMGLTSDLVFDDPALDDFAAGLTKDTSALVILGDETMMESFVGAVTPLKGRLIQTDLNEKDVETIRKALKK